MEKKIREQSQHSNQKYLMQHDACFTGVNVGHEGPEKPFHILLNPNEN